MLHSFLVLHIMYTILNPIISVFTYTYITIILYDNHIRREGMHIKKNKQRKTKKKNKLSK